jgi:hypothetical protein
MVHIQVFNRARQPIIVRYKPNGQHSINVNQSLNLDLPANTELFATKQRDEYTAFARLLVHDTSTDMHFTDIGGGYGPGQIQQETPATTGSQSLTFWEPASLAADNSSSSSKPVPDESSAVGAPLMNMMSQSQPQQQQGLVEIPGLGYVNPQFVPEKVKQRMMAAAAPSAPAEPQPPARPPVYKVQHETAKRRDWLLPSVLIVVLVSVIFVLFRKKIFGA